MDILDSIDYFLSAKRAEGLSEITVTGYGKMARQFAEWLGETDPKKIDKEAIRGYIRHLQDKGLARSTVNRYVREVKVWVRWLRDDDEIEIDPFVKVKIPKIDRTLMPFIPDEDFERLLAACNRKSPLGRRDYAMLCFLWDTGVRVSELVGLRRDQMDMKAGTAKVIGKGSKERFVFFSPTTITAMLGYRAKLGREATSPYFFLSASFRQMTPTAVNQMLDRLSNKAGVTVGTNPHAFRHSFARNYLMAGGDLHSLQRLLGHSSLEVVRLYLNLTTEDLAEKHRQFSPMSLRRSVPARPRSGVRAASGNE